MENTYQDWEFKSNQRKSFVYYGGVEAGNPSGETSNIKYVNLDKYNVERQSWVTVITQEIIYDSADNILSITKL